MSDDATQDPKAPMFGPNAVRPIESKQTDPYAIWCVSLAAGSVPLVCCCTVFSAPLIVASIICGMFSIGRINDEPEKWSGLGMSITGLVVSGINLLVLLFYVGIALLGSVDWDQKVRTSPPGVEGTKTRDDARTPLDNLLGTPHAK